MNKNALGAPLALFGVPLPNGARIRTPRFSARPMSVRLRVAASSVGSSVVVLPLSAGWIARLEIDYVFGLVGQARRVVLHPRNFTSGSVLLVQSALDSILPLRLRSSPDKDRRSLACLLPLPRHFVRGRHRPPHESPEHRHGESGFTVAWRVDHALCDQRGPDRAEAGGFAAHMFSDGS